VYRYQYNLPISPLQRVVSSGALPTSTSDVRIENANLLSGFYAIRGTGTDILSVIEWNIDPATFNITATPSAGW
jgi:hypothetical protein